MPITDRADAFVQSLESIHRQYELAVDEGDEKSLRETRTKAHIQKLEEMYEKRNLGPVIEVLNKNAKELKRINEFEFVHCEKHGDAARIVYKRESSVVEGAIDYYIVIFNNESGKWKMGESGSQNAVKLGDKGQNETIETMIKDLNLKI